MEFVDRIEGYVLALYEAARAEGEIDRIGDELFRIATAVRQSDELHETLTDRRIPFDRKRGIIRELLGNEALPATANMVEFIVGAGLARDLPELARRFIEHAEEIQSKELAVVRSAVELDEATIARLAAALGRATGKQVTVKVEIDPSVVGGISARVGDMEFDGSLRSRFDELRDALTGAEG
jgi:F-type H+-transporting ATPase subunit delta